MSTELLLPGVHEALHAAVAERAAAVSGPSTSPQQRETSAQLDDDAGATVSGQFTSPQQRETSARRGPARPTHGGRRRRRWLHGLPLLLGGMLVAGSGVAATTVWNPFAGEPDAPRAIRGPAPAEHLASLGILRRPQRASDRSPLVTAGLARMQTREGRGIYLDSVRVIGPTRAGGWCAGNRDRTMTCHTAPAVGFVFLRTRAARGDALAAADRSVPICVGNAWDMWRVDGGLPPGSRLRASGRPARLADRAVASTSCTSMHRVRMKGLWAGGSLSAGHLLGVVPDGVAAVRATTSGGQLVTAKVSDNIVQLDAPGPAHRFHQGSLRWLDAHGRVLRRF